MGFVAMCDELVHAVWRHSHCCLTSLPLISDRGCAALENFQTKKCLKNVFLASRMLWVWCVI